MSDMLDVRDVRCQDRALTCYKDAVRELRKGDKGALKGARKPDNHNRGVADHAPKVKQGEAGASGSAPRKVTTGG